MERIENLPEGWEPTVEEYRRYVAKGILFREVQRIVRSMDVITAYRINVSAYTAALLAEKTARRIDLDRIWNDQAISKALYSTIESWAPVVFKHLPLPAQQAGKHIDDSFKTEACWNYIRGLDLSVPAAIERELASAVNGSTIPVGDSARRKTESLTSNDHNNIALCMELSESQWSKIAAWGQASKALAERERGIARTIAGYAAENWKRTPSVKQAKYAAKMIETARRAGLFDAA